MKSAICETVSRVNRGRTSLFAGRILDRIVKFVKGRHSLNVCVRASFRLQTYIAPLSQTPIRLSSLPKRGASQIYNSG